MHDGGLLESHILVAPARRLGKGEVHLHIGAPIPEFLGAGAYPRRNKTRIKQLEIKLMRSYITDDGPASGEDVVLDAHAYSPSLADLDAIHVRVGRKRASVIAD